MVRLPYTELELRISLLGLDEEILNEELNEKLNNKFGSLNDKADLNKKIAEHNGISVKDLIDSPNYKTLHEEYIDSVTHQVIKELTNAGLEDKQAWALVAIGSGLLKV